MRSKEKAAHIVRAIQSRDGRWSAVVRIIGSKVEASISFPDEPIVGRHIKVVGSGSQWSAA